MDQESENSQEILSLPSFTKDTVKILDTSILPGNFKRAIEVELTNPISGEKNVALAKLFRRKPLLVTDQDKLTNTQRQSLFDKEIRDSLLLSKLIPQHTARLLGLYKTDIIKPPPYFVEKIIGKPVGSREGEVIARPTLEQFNKFKSSLDNLISKGIILSYDSLLPHNLMIGTNSAT